MAESSPLRIAGISALITLLISGSASMALFGAGVLSSSEDAPNGASADSSAAQASQSSEATTLEPDAQPSAQNTLLTEPAPPMPSNVDCATVKCVALTFDDGPHPEVTPRILQTLRQTGTPATFFQLGKQIPGNEALLKKALADGHVLATHTWNHLQLSQLSAEQIRQEITSTKKASQDATGVAPTLMRPPYGLYNQAVVDTVTATHDSIIMWDVDTEDWKNKNAAQTADRALKEARRGSIILMHDIQPTTADALPQIIDGLRKAGYALVTVPQLLGQTTPGSVHFSGEPTE